MKIKQENISLALQRIGFGADVVNRVLAEVNSIESQDLEEREAPIKKQYAFLLNDPQGKFKAEELSGWVVQIPEEESVYGLLDKVYKTACDFNLSAKGRRYPLRRVSELMEFCTPKIAKEHKLWIKTKEPIAVISTNNAIE